MLPLAVNAELAGMGLVCCAVIPLTHSSIVAHSVSPGDIQATTQ